MILRQKYRAVPPSNGQTRIRKRFAWKPIAVEDAVIWLRSYEVIEAYIVNSYKVKIAGEDGVLKEMGAHIGNWFEIEKHL